MAKFILDVLALAIGAGIGYWLYHQTQTATAAVAGVVVGGLFTLIAWMGIASFGIVPAGSTGVVLSWGRPTGELKESGYYFAPTPLGYSVYEMQSSAIRQKPVDNAEAASKDLQQVSTDVMFNYHLDQNPRSLINVYTNLRDNFDDIIGPITLEAVKAVTANFTAQELIDKRSQVKDQLDTLLRDRLGHYGIVVDNVSLTQFKFSDQFNTAIEAKVTQEQQALQAKAKLQQVYYEAQQTITQARADAQALALKRANITPLLVQEDWIKQWDGKMPLVMGGGNMIGLPSGFFGSESSR